MPEQQTELHEPSHELDLDASVPYTFVLVDGAFNASYWYPFARVLLAAGHNVIHPALPIQDPNASFEDDAEIVRREIKDCHNVVLMTHSRGIETTRLLATEDLGQFVAAQIVSSGGPHSHRLHTTYSRAHESRYTQGYQKAIQKMPNNMTRINAEDAHRYLYHDVEHLALVEAITDNLRDQRDSSNDQSLAFTLPTGLLPIKVWLGARDRALNIPRAQQVFQHWAHITPDLLDTGHTPQLAITTQFVRYAIDFANQARKTTQ